MELLVKVVIWKVQTTNAFNTWWEEGVDERIEKLRKALTQGWQEVDQLDQTFPLDLSRDTDVLDHARPLYVFAAPEWLFRRGKDPNQTFGLDERDKFERALPTLSSGQAEGINQGRRVLLVPGTVHWRCPRSGAEDNVRGSVAAYEEKKRMKAKTVQPRAGAVVKDITDRVLPAPQDKKNFGYNQALIYYQGELRKVVQKEVDAGDFGSVDATTVLVPGLGSGAFSLKDLGLKVGVAICYDHKRIMEYGKEVDLYLLLSASQSLEPEKVGARKGGLMVHADGGMYSCRIHQLPVDDKTLQERKKNAWATNYVGRTSFRKPPPGYPGTTDFAVGRALVTVGTPTVV
jgi:hypothetical protein